MTVCLLALLLRVVAGLRSMAASALVSRKAQGMPRHPAAFTEEAVAIGTAVLIGVALR